MEQLSLWDYKPAKKRGVITVKTRSGEVEVTAKRVIGQCALHTSLTYPDSYTLTHIASGLGVAYFTSLVTLKMATALAEKMKAVDLDAYAHNPNTKIGEQVKQIVMEWKRELGFTMQRNPQ